MTNPYAPPGYESPGPAAPPQDLEAFARDKVRLPGIFLAVLSGLLFLMFSFDLVLILSGGFGDVMGAVGGMPVREPLMLGVCIFAIVANVVCFVGAIQMVRLRTWWLALTAAILSIVPFTSSICCVLNLPFAIWAIVVLAKGEVRSAFR